MIAVARRRAHCADAVADGNRLARPAEAHQDARAFTLDRPALAVVTLDDDDGVRVRPHDLAHDTAHLEPAAAVEAEHRVMRLRSARGDAAAQSEEKRVPEMHAPRHSTCAPRRYQVSARRSVLLT